MPATTCPDCGRPLPAGAPAGLCPACLLALGTCAPGASPDDAVTEEAPAADGERPSARIGRYRLLEVIGEGGFGTVWMAEQQEPVRRRVALKILKAGMDTKQVLARFEAERQALALMDHPNIARVFDGGATGAGRPYFVMELVRGLPFTGFCDARQLTTRERLELFITVCHAVQHAHQKGVIHRDLKPSNILVTEQDGRPVTKVIDFGVAKAVAEPLTDKTLFTRFHQFLGTPAYMSPEQAGLGGLDVDTRTDIYALGVLLYELLTGRTPLDARRLQASGPEAMLRAIREADPPRPSTRLSTLAREELAAVAARRREDPRRLPRLLRGSLDWIVLRAIEKDRSRRYETASALADDLRSFLDGNPVTAVPPSLTYRVGTRLRKHRVAWATALVVALLLSTATVVSLREARHATRQAAIAEKHRRVAETNQQWLREAIYSSDMNLAGQALAVNSLERARALVERHNPSAGGPDLHGWEWAFFQSEIRDQSAFSLPPRRQLFERISLSPDGSTIALPGGRTNVVELWDVGSRSTREELPIKAFWLKFSPQGRYLAAADFGRLVVWDLNARAVRHEWPRGYVADAAFTDDEAYLAATTFPLEGDRPLSLELWRLSDGARVAVRPFGIRGRAQAFAVAIAPDQRRLVVSPSTGDLLFLRLPDLAEEGRLAVHDDRIISLAYSPDGRWLAAGSGFRDSVVRLWDLRDGQRVYSLRGHAGWVRSVTFSKDSRFLASASSDQSARIWDVQSKSEVRILRGHQSQLFSVDFGPDGDLLMTGAKLGEAKLWSLVGRPGGGERRNLPPLTLPDLSRDHRWFAGVSPAGRVVWGGVSEPSVVHELSAAGTNGLVARFSPDAGWLAVGGRRGEVELHSRTTGERRIAPAVHRHPIRILWFTHPSGGLVSMDESGHGVCWTDELRSTREWQLPPECALVYLALEPVRGFLVADLRGHGRRVFRLGDGGVEAALNDGGIGATAAALSPNGTLLAISDDDGTVEVWDVRTWSLVASLRGHLAAVGSVAFSPDGRRLVTGSNGSEAVRFWEVQHWQQVCDLPVLSAYNLFLSFSNDGRSLAFSTGPHLQVLRID